MTIDTVTAVLPYLALAATAVPVLRSLLLPTRATWDRFEHPERVERSSAAWLVPALLLQAGVVLFG